MENIRSVKNILFLIIFAFVVSCTQEENSNHSPNNPVSAKPSIVTLDNSPVQIGNQIWTKRNLNVSRYRNGDIIPQVQDQTQWSNLTTGAWCYYNNDIANGAIYGKLYNWYAVNDPRGLAPQGWHVPSATEWEELITTAGGSNNAGGYLRANVFWTGSLQSYDIYGFSALPSGYRNPVFFDTLGSYMNFWTSSESSEYSARHYYGNSVINNIFSYTSTKNYGFAIRCVKNN